MGNIVSIFIAAIIIAVALMLVFALPTYWLWNWLMPTIFGLTKISFWQAFGLNLLSYIFFGPKNGSSSKD